MGATELTRVPGEGLRVFSEGGAGRTLIVLRESGSYEDLARATALVAQRTHAVIAVEVDTINHRSLASCRAALDRFLLERSVRQATWIAFGAATAVVQLYAIFSPKIVRSAVLVDASTRAHPTRLESLVSRLEQWLPLGLPLRRRTPEFDSQAFLHRVRCPVLVVQSRIGTVLQRSSAHDLVRLAPTAWSVELKHEDQAEELCQLVEAFAQVPARAPQKNVVR